MYTVYDRMYGDFPAKNTACTPYRHINVCFWPTLVMCHASVRSIQLTAMKRCSKMSHTHIHTHTHITRAGQNIICNPYVTVYFDNIPARNKVCPSALLGCLKFACLGRV